LGLGAARALAAAGAQVVICGRDEARLHDAARQIGAIPVVQDVSGLDGGKAFVDKAIDALGGIDILVANAGGPPLGGFRDTDLELYAKAIDVNLLSVIAMCKAAVPAMEERGWGRVVAITSLTVRQPAANLILSTTARAGLTGFLKTLAREVAPNGVTVNSLQPGYHATDRVMQTLGSRPDAVAHGVPAGIIGDADEFGQVVAFLCSAQARFITGASVPVDGGAHAGLL
jgi:3-oxoacyl-[acyl-carrier protein] reductase